MISRFVTHRNGTSYTYYARLIVATINNAENVSNIELDIEQTRHGKRQCST